MHPPLQMYRVRYAEKSAGQFQYRDVQPVNSTVFTVTGLLPSTKYTVAVMAYNQLGESGYQRRELELKTTGEPTPPLVRLLRLCRSGSISTPLN